MYFLRLIKRWLGLNDDAKTLREIVLREHTILHDREFLSELSRIGELFPAEVDFLFRYVKLEKKSYGYIHGLFNSGIFDRTNKPQDSKSEDDFSILRRIDF